MAKNKSSFTEEQAETVDVVESNGTPIAKKTIIVNVGKEYQLNEGESIPAEIPEAFYNSFRTAGVI